MPTKIEGRTVDGRYSKPVDKVDKGAMSFLRIPLPTKKAFKPAPKSHNSSSLKQVVTNG